MKKANTIMAIILFTMAGCGGNKQSADDIMTIDVTASYPKKELILQDFMDVEYIPLETSDEFITMGWVHSIGKEIIIVRNRNRSSDGDIFFFNRKDGKGLKKINHLGPSGEEYMFLLGVTLDEENKEIFVNDHWTRKILVYDLAGNFKRSLNHEKDRQYIMEIYNFDQDHLICHDGALDEKLLGSPNVFLVISKQDGSITKEIVIPYKEKISSNVMLSGSNSFMPIRNRTLIPYRGNSWMLMEVSADTIYQFQSDYSLIPLIARTPSIQSMTPGIFLYPAVLTDRYCFMQTVKAEWDWVANTGHTRVNLMYDKEENAIFEYVMYNADYTSKQPVIMTSEITFGNDEIACVHTLEAEELVEAYENGKLTGKLKEIAATLDEDSNPVLMLIKYK